jgi:hypothetical protein
MRNVADWSRVLDADGHDNEMTLNDIEMDVS